MKQLLLIVLTFITVVANAQVTQTKSTSTTTTQSTTTVDIQELARLIALEFDQTHKGWDSIFTSDTIVIPPIDPPTTVEGYYVTVNGTSANDGSSESKSWSLSHAVSTAVAGDVIHIKAGDYGDLRLRTVRSGTESKPIKFIGYKDFPNDIQSNGYSTYTYEDFDNDNAVLPSDLMPLIETNRGSDNAPTNADKGFDIRHKYIHLENIMFQYQQISIKINAYNATVINCYSNETGNWDENNPGWDESFSSSNLSGYGIYAVSGAKYFTLKSSTVFNAGADAIFIVGADYHTGEYNSIYMDKSGNSTDYMYCVYSAEDMTLNHNRTYRYLDRDTNKPLPHRSRGLALKCNSNDNVIKDFYVYNSRIVIYDDSNRNEFTDIVSEGTNENFTGAIIIADRSDDNKFYDAIIKKGYVEFNDYLGGCVDAFVGSGNNNYFYNLNIESVADNSVGGGFINIANAIWSRENRTVVSAGTNYFIGGTWQDAPFLMVQDRPVTTFLFKNINFKNVYEDYKDNKIRGSEQSGNFIYEGCTFEDVNFNTPN